MCAAKRGGLPLVVQEARRCGRAVGAGDASAHGSRAPGVGISENASRMHLCGRGQFSGDGGLVHLYHINAVRLTPTAAPFIMYLPRDAPSATAWDHKGNNKSSVLPSALTWLPTVRDALAQGTLVSFAPAQRPPVASTALHWTLTHTTEDVAGRCYVLCLVDHGTSGALPTGAARRPLCAIRKCV